MPVCILRCERCGQQQDRSLDSTEFGLMLANGQVPLRCSSCSDTTDWKLVVPPRPPPKVRRDTRPRRLLVIDDDRNTLQVLQMMLRSKEYLVESALSADEAIQKLQTADFDAIVSDIRMPGFDGQSLFRFLAVYLPSYTGKVVFLTGDQSEKTLRFLKECGCPYTFKPIDLRQLESCIRQVS